MVSFNQPGPTIGATRKRRNPLGGATGQPQAPSGPSSVPGPAQPGPAQPATGIAGQAAANNLGLGGQGAAGFAEGVRSDVASPIAVDPERPDPGYIGEPNEPGTGMGVDGSSYGDDVDSIMERLVQDRLSGALGEIDTSDEDALIRELMGDQIGAGRVGNRAAMGRGGFAESGAALAMGADIERAARQAATQQMLDVRQREEEQAFNEAMGAGDLDIAARQAANEAAIIDARMQAIEALMGGTGGDAGGAGGDAGRDPIQDAAIGRDPWAQSRRDNELARQAAESQREALASASEVTSPPDGSDFVWADDNGDRYYRDADGNLYVVRGGFGGQVAAGEGGPVATWDG